MTDVGLIVRGAILMKRAETCDHIWVRINETEEQCQLCTVIVTEQGKKMLMARRRRCVHGTNPPEACEHCSRHLEKRGE
jgi:hypothetical protein